jgi:hypothetical protein
METRALVDHLPSEAEEVVGGGDGVSVPGTEGLAEAEEVLGGDGVSGTEGLATGAGVGTTDEATVVKLQQVGAI